MPVTISLPSDRRRRRKLLKDVEFVPWKLNGSGHKDMAKVGNMGIRAPGGASWLLLLLCLAATAAVASSLPDG